MDIQKITSMCEADCTVCNNLIQMFSEEGVSLDMAMSNRQKYAEAYIAKFGKPVIFGIEPSLDEAVFEIRCAIADLRSE